MCLGKEGVHGMHVAPGLLCRDRLPTGVTQGVARSPEGQESTTNRPLGLKSVRMSEGLVPSGGSGENPGLSSSSSLWGPTFFGPFSTSAFNASSADPLMHPLHSPLPPL